MKKMLFGLIATAMFSVSANAKQILNLKKSSTEICFSEQPRIPIKITLEFGRASKNCEGWGVCKLDISIDIETAFEATTNSLGNLVLQTNNTGIDEIKNHFGSASTVSIEEDFKLSDETCKSLDLKLGYTIKAGKYSIKNISKGVYNITL